MAYGTILGQRDKPKYITLTLSSTGWQNNQQTVTANGVLGDETEQLILVMPPITSQAAYMQAGIYCSNQSNNKLTFSCTTVPSENIDVYVTIQGVVK